MTVVSKPSPVRNPAHSSATYAAPTTRVLPGGASCEKMSSELRQYSCAPGMSGYAGRPPTATTILSAVIREVWRFRFVTSIVCASTILPSSLRYSTDSSRSATL
eukprot:Amastigsp_a677752_82.p3 type:complete len:104 gc:universal Amastigsp_a677752_82:807-496(-)